MGAPKLVYATHAAPHHYFPNHPECPERVIAIEGALKQLQALQSCLAAGQALRLDDPPPALPEGLLEAVHTAQHVERLRATSAAVKGPTAVRDPDDPDGPTFATPSSFTDALHAARTAVRLVDAVVAASSSSSSSSSSVAGSNAVSSDGSAHAACGTVGFSLCRPPGHHATPSDQMGFCLLNNAALAARHAQRAHGLHSVLVLDLDVHHGNGTQDMFYDDPSVMLIDVHQQGVWPGSGRLEEAGQGPGAGGTINVPLPWHSGHSAAQRTFERVVAPAARRFRPDLIIVSAGYDAHWQDPLEHLQFQAATYHWLTAQLRELAAELCGGRLLLLLEGGYNTQALAECVAETVLALLGRPSEHPLLQPSQLPHAEPMDAVEALLEEVRRLHGLS